MRVVLESVLPLNASGDFLRLSRADVRIVRDQFRHAVVPRAAGIRGAQIGLDDRVGHVRFLTQELPLRHEDINNVPLELAAVDKHVRIGFLEGFGHIGLPKHIGALVRLAGRPELLVHGLGPVGPDPPFLWQTGQTEMCDDGAGEELAGGVRGQDEARIGIVQVADAGDRPLVRNHSVGPLCFVDD